jgi:hypothetical protein
MIQGDSVEYDLLAKWADFDCDGDHSCEIGVRDGMGSKIIMDNIKNNYYAYWCRSLWRSSLPTHRQSRELSTGTA